MILALQNVVCGRFRFPSARLLACLILIHFADFAYAQSPKLAWDPNLDSNLAGYRVYRSEQAGVYGSISLNAALLTTTSFTDATVQSGRTYYYVVTAVSTSGQESGYSNAVQVTIPVSVTNRAPLINAGPDQTITLPAAATVTATATDDGLPNGTLTYKWSVLSGSGVVLTAPTSAATSASFSAAGTYAFRVTVSDGQLSSVDDVVVTVKPVTVTNLAPAVSAGSDQTITLPAAATVTATATDDGLPNGTLTYKWSVLSGSGVVLTAPTSATTSASFSAAGTYALRVIVSDGQLSSVDDVVVTVKPVTVTNRAPAVSAGSDQTITLPAAATVTATATDDGLPNGTLTYKWSVLSGSGVVLTAPTSATTSASFSAAGTYAFRVTVSDGEFSSSADLTIYVNPAPSGTLSFDPTVSELTLVVSRKNEILQQSSNPVLVESTDGRVQKLELYINGQLKAVSVGTSLRYRWDTKKQPGNYILEAWGYDVTGRKVGFAKASVEVR